MIYDCKMPHPEDWPKGGFFKDNSNMVDSYCQGYKFTYDKTMVRNA